MPGTWAAQGGCDGADEDLTGRFGCPDAKSAHSSIVSPDVESQAKVARGLLRRTGTCKRGDGRAGAWRLSGEDAGC